MKKETWDKVKADMPIIFLSTFASSIMSYFFNNSNFCLFCREFFGAIMGMLLANLLCVGIAYLIVFIWYRLTKRD